MKKVLYVLTGETIGGITTGLSGLLRHLHPRRYRAVVAVTKAGSPVPLHFRKQGVPCVRLSPRRPQAFLQRLIKREQIQLVQTCDAATEGARVAHEMGLPHVWFIGGTLENSFAAPSLQALPLLRILMDRLSSVVVVPSRAVARSEFPALPARRLRVIPWGVDFPSPPHLKVPPAQPVVGMVGNFYPAKLHLDFLRAAARIHRAFPEARFAIAGRLVRGSPLASFISRRYRADVAGAIRRLKLARRVTVTEFSPEERASWYQNVTLLLCPSEEGLSQALLEASLFGVPVIAAKAGGTLEVFQHERSGFLVPAGDIPAMAGAALRALRDPRWAQQLGLAARRRILARFTAKRQAARFQRLYDALLTKKQNNRNGGRSPRPAPGAASDQQMFSASSGKGSGHASGKH